MKTLELKHRNGEYVYEDESGYRVVISTAYDNETGWHSTVTFWADGFKTENAAIESLIHPLRHALNLFE